MSNPPIETAFTGGEVHDVKGYEALMEEPALELKALSADRGYEPVGEAGST
jgi:hypothetical protein